MIGYEDFERRARELFLEIPAQFRERVEGPVVEEAAKGHENLPGSFLLGECVHHPDWSGESPLFSTVFLYYGSFVKLARRDPDFDVDAELRETVQHEVRHHLEDAAGIPTLRDLDWAEDENELRRDERPFAPGFWRAGERLGERTWRVGDDVFVEVELRSADWARASEQGLVLDVAGGIVELRPGELPQEPPADEPFVLALPADDYGDVVIVASRRRGLSSRGPFRR